MELDTCCRRKHAIHAVQSLQQVLPITTLYYKACTKHMPVRLRTTKLAQNTFQYCFAIQSLRKVLPSITSYYKACTKYFPVLLRTTSSTRTRRGGSCLRFDDKTFSSIELAPAVRRACLLRANLLRCCWPRT